jgi:hypothetical protein
MADHAAERRGMVDTQLVADYWAPFLLLGAR